MKGRSGKKASKGTKMATGGSVTDPKTGKTYDKPSYGGASLKGLTSSDPANVARNRAAAATYSTLGNRGNGGSGAASEPTTPRKPLTMFQQGIRNGNMPQLMLKAMMQAVAARRAKSAPAAPAPAMKKGGKVKAGMRGCGCATRGTKGGKMV